MRHVAGMLAPHLPPAWHAQWTTMTTFTRCHAVCCNLPHDKLAWLDRPSTLATAYPMALFQTISVTCRNVCRSSMSYGYNGIDVMQWRQSKRKWRARRYATQHVSSANILRMWPCWFLMAVHTHMVSWLACEKDLFLYTIYRS